MRTLDNRRETLSEDLSALESRRDLLRRARASEPLTDDEQSQLERELHATSLESARRAMTRAARANSSEDEGFSRLQELCIGASSEPETKVETLIDYLSRVWEEDERENIILFTEYRDTAESLAGAGGSLISNFGKRVVLLHGDVDSREEVLAKFIGGDGALLVTTDVASEGLNLQERCRRVIHYDLPWNPNRLEQRNGRVDRYGQKREPKIAFFYAKDTYDGEILRMLVGKIERQISALGSVGDVLGALQYRTVEALFDDPAQVLTPELSRALETRVTQVIEDASVPEILRDVKTPNEEIRVERHPDLGRFVVAAVNQSGGAAAIEGNVLCLERYPTNWDRQVPAIRYALPGGPSDLPLLTLFSPLARSAINAIREQRYDRVGDPRSAARTHAAVSEPTLVATFLCSVRSRDGFTEERLEVLAAGRSGGIFDAAATLLTGERYPEPGDLAVRAREAMAQVWGSLYETLRNRASSFLERWSGEIRANRDQALARHRASLNDWYAAERYAIVRGRDDRLMLPLHDEPSQAEQRELETLELDRQRQLRDLEARAVIEAVTCEPIGILLVLPTTA